MVEEIQCKRCGRCCHYTLNGKVKRCKHLIRLSSGKTLCRIYNKRLGKVIDKGIVCMMREQDKHNYKDCPYNKNYEYFDVGY